DLAAVCYNSCDACQSAPGCTDSGAVNYDSAAQNDDGSCLYAVTFQVDLSARGLADGDIVYTNGTYNGWCGGCNAMTDAGDGLWTGTFNLPAGDQEYKFTINAWSDQEFFDGTESCTTDPAEYVNRVANISAATTLPVVCWNSCEACPLVAGCMDSSACNYNADAEVDDASCTYPAHPNFDCDGNCNNDADGDGICDELEVAGCTNPNALNYDASATDEDGTCLLLGCTDPEADNYDATANVDGECSYPMEGCTDAAAVNYDATALVDDGTCLFLGCMDPEADNYDPNANVDNGFCVYTGCTDSSAANYDPQANTNDGSCLYGGCLDPAYLEYDPTADVDDGSCTTLIVEGCTDPDFTEYDEAANVDDGSCATAVVFGCTDPNFIEYDPAANTYDGSCMTPLIEGCTDPAYTEYFPEANTDDGSCATLVEEGCTDPGYLEYNEFANTDDGSCVTPVVVGCLEAEACNYNADANTAGACEYPMDLYGVDYVDCDGNCLADADGDGVCDQAEVPGCTDATAVNFSEAATDEDGSCLYGGCTDPAYIEFDPSADVDDGSCATLVVLGCTDSDYIEYNPDANVDDGSCDELVSLGCTDPVACNYSGGYNVDDGSCIYAVDIYGNDNVDCFGACLNDADGDGVCDEDELAGCTDPAACNYSFLVTEDDGSCEFCSCYEPEVVPGPDTLTFDSDSAGYGAKLVRVAQHVGGALDGLTTYRLYVTAQSPDDKLSSVFGN
ncbi:MAG: hypothetical protein ACPG85_03740, partial [Flavobacteriales bacterium]